MNTYPYIEAHWQSGVQRRPSLIKIVPSWTTSDSGAALAVANHQHTKSSPHETSHFTVDESKIYQCVPIKKIAGGYDAMTKGQIRITACFNPPDVEFGWVKESHLNLLENLKSLVVQLTSEYKIRPRILSYYDYDLWRYKTSRRNGGIYAPLNVPWPKDEFLLQLDRKRSEY